VPAKIPNSTLHEERTSDKAEREQSQTDLQDHIPGSELPVAVYLSAAASLAWMLFVVWYAFGIAGRIDFDLMFVSLIFLMFLGIPTIIHHVAVRWTHGRNTSLDDFLDHPVQTATGALSPAQAWIQILMIPLSLALAATLIGMVRYFT